MSDLISRQAAITAIQKAYADTEGGTDKCAVWKNVGLTNALHIMQDLPSAQSASYRQVTGKLDSVSRQAEIDAWKADFKGYVDCLDLLRDDYNGIMEYIDETPSAQPDIIRCKDCKHRPFDSEDTQGFGVEFPDEKCPCQCDDGWFNWRPNNEWFCANAERRTDVKADKGASR